MGWIGDPAFRIVPTLSVSVLAGLLAVTCAHQPTPVARATSPAPEKARSMATPAAAAAPPIARSGPAVPGSGTEVAAIAAPFVRTAPAGNPTTSAFPPLVLVRWNGGGRFELSPESEAGGFDEDDLAAAREAMAFRGGATHDVDARLLDLLYMTVLHFDAPHVVVTSGYRPGRQASLHAWGRAVDLQLPGVDYRQLAEHLRTYGFVGVGIYPRTGNVHLDVREQSFFWVSWAPRGRRWREQEILPDLAREMDRDARERGETPPDPLPAAGRLARERSSLRRRSPAKVRRRPAAKRASAQRSPVAARQSRRAPP